MQVAQHKTSAVPTPVPILRSSAAVNLRSCGDDPMRSDICRQHQTHVADTAVAHQCKKVDTRSLRITNACELGDAAPSRGLMDRTAQEPHAACSDQGGRNDSDVMCIACSGVDKDVLERCRRAVRNLGKARMFETENEVLSTTLTHLVVGNEKRSSKFLHAIACGANIVTPAWLVQCIRWRGWIACESFLCKVWQIPTF